LLLVLLPTPALAHPGNGDAAGLLHGLLHPISGPDHLLAALGVGLLAWMLNGRARWAVPAAFVAVTTLTALIATFRLAPAMIETGIGLSILGTGLLLARGKPVPHVIALTLAALFALFHGQAHSSAMPANAAGLFYGLGLTLTTSALLAAGILVGCAMTRVATTGSLALVRAGGLALSVNGALLLVTTLAF
jgi:urease accessory protein